MSCKCGCGRDVGSKTFAHGHNRRGVKCSAETMAKRQAAWGALGPMTGRTHTAESRARMSATPRQKRGAMPSPQRAKIGDALRGLSKSKEHRQKLSDANRIDGVTWRHGRAWLYAPEHPAANDKGRVKRARIVLEGEIGRLLKANEVAHHINLDISDDSPANLRVLTRSAHTKLHWEQGDIRGSTRQIA